MERGDHLGWSLLVVGGERLAKEGTGVEKKTRERLGGRRAANLGKA